MFRALTTSGSEPISTPSSIRTRRLATGSPSSRGLVDTSVAVEWGAIASAGISIEVAISTLTLAELIAGPYAAGDDLTRMRRQNHLRRVKEQAEALPFDSDCAHAWGRIYTAAVRAGRKARGSRAIDLMIAATALAHDLPLYTLNAQDLRSLEGLIEIVDIGS